MSELDIYDLLDTMKITYEVIEHDHVATIDELRDTDIKKFEYVVKNLFVRDDKKKNYYLVIVRNDKTLQMKELQIQLQSRRLSFASQQDLYQYMKLMPGEVTPFGLFNDMTRSIQVVFDCDIADIIGVHPLRNDKTLFMKTYKLIELIQQKGFKMHWINI